MRNERCEALQASSAKIEHAERGPQRADAPHRAHGEGLRGREARADYRAAVPDKVITTSTKKTDANDAATLAYYLMKEQEQSSFRAS